MSLNNSSISSDTQNRKKFPTITKRKIIFSILVGLVVIISGIDSKNFDYEKATKNATLAIGILTYIDNEKSKHLQYVEGKIKDFENALETINVRKMLNTELQCIELFPFLDGTESAYRYHIVKDKDWGEALLESNLNSNGNNFLKINRDEPLYNQESAIKAAIRDNFNCFLNHLQNFERMIESKVVSEEMLSNYLEPWFEFIERASLKYVNCPNTEKYTCREILLEYIGILDVKIPDYKLSIIQKDVRNLVKRYRNLDTLLPKN